ncbi:MAG: bifunctional riboflavin kinase/FAD synthetase [Ferruginibacter sp.]|nr:bifunctional riboflavin kinase/FAD synthetase [Ferruginibacter sp.]
MMEIYQNIETLPIFQNAVITIGTFDGVHLGHLKVIQQLTEEARKANGVSILITFYPHPKQIVGYENKILYTLNSPEEKYMLLEKTGIEKLVVVPFDKSFSDLSAEEYISNFLVKKFNPKTIIIGYDHRFGKNRSGNYELLQKHSENYGYTVKEIPEHILKDITISSTAIRNALLNGEVKIANTYLGYNYFFSGKVIEGHKIGRTIKFPTANIEITDNHKLIPKNGVYVANVKIEGEDSFLKGMMNIGTRPTFYDTERHIEVHLFDFNGDLYNKTLTVHIVDRIRDEMRFANADELKNQLEKDEKSAKKIFLS